MSRQPAARVTAYVHITNSLVVTYTPVPSTHMLRQWRTVQLLQSSRPALGALFTSARPTSMPSSKGEPTDPELREEIKEEVKEEEKGNSHCPSYPTQLPFLQILWRVDDRQVAARAAGRRGKPVRWRDSTKRKAATTRTRAGTRTKRRKALRRRRRTSR